MAVPCKCDRNQVTPPGDDSYHTECVVNDKYLRTFSYLFTPLAQTNLRSHRIVMRLFKRLRCHRPTSRMSCLIKQQNRFVNLLIGLRSLLYLGCRDASRHRSLCRQGTQNCGSHMTLDEIRQILPDVTAFQFNWRSQLPANIAQRFQFNHAHSESVFFKRPSPREGAATTMDPVNPNQILGGNGIQCIPPGSATGKGGAEHRKTKTQHKLSA